MIARVLAALLALVALAPILHAADTYTVDGAHTTIGFRVSHLVISKVHGRFNEFTGQITLSPQDPPALLAVTGSIQAASIDTGIADRDKHLRNADFFDVEQHPQITFQSTKVETQDGQPILVGTFTMHGVSRELRVPVTVTGPIKDPRGKTRIGLAATLTINRQDYGLTYNKVLETGGLAVGQQVEIDISAEAVKDAPPSP